MLAGDPCSQRRVRGGSGVEGSEWRYRYCVKDMDVWLGGGELVKAWSRTPGLQCAMLAIAEGVGGGKNF